MKNYFIMLYVLACAVLLLTSSAYSQNAASVTWNLILPDSLNVSTVVGNLTGLPAAGSDSFKVISYSGTGWWWSRAVRRQFLQMESWLRLKLGSRDR